MSLILCSVINLHVMQLLYMHGSRFFFCVRPLFILLEVSKRFNPKVYSHGFIQCLDMVLHHEVLAASTYFWTQIE